MNTRPQKGLYVGVVIVIAICLTAAILIPILNYPLQPGTDRMQEGPQINAVDALQSRLQRTISAAALLENDELDKAVQAYVSMIRDDAQDGSAARNLAIAYLAKLNGLNSKINEMSREEKNSDAGKSIRESLLETVSTAKAAVDRAIQLQPHAPEPYRLAIALELAIIEQQPAALQNANRKLLLKKMDDYTTKTSGDAYLACKLDDLREQFFSNANAVDRAAANQLTLRALRAAWKNFPRNLNILTRLSERLVAEEDKSVLELVDTFKELSQPFSVNENDREILTILKEASDLAANDFEGALLQITLAQNLIKSTAAYRADMNATDPNILSMIDLSSAQAALQKAIDKKKPDSLSVRRADYHVTKLIDENGSEIGGNFACWFDWDIDLRPEVVWISESKLSIGTWDRTSPEQLKTIAAIEIPAETQRVIPADLFEVQFPGRPVVNARRVQEEFLREGRKNTEIDLRADTIRSLILLGKNGIDIVTIEEVSNDEKSRLSWKLIEKPKGFETIKNAKDCQLIDWDADGDLDLAVLSEGKIDLLQNRGNREFDLINATSVLPPETIEVLSVVAADYDRDQDLDLVLSTAIGTTPCLLENILHSQFRFRELGHEWESIQGAKQLAIAELDGNVSWDFISSSAEGTRVCWTSTQEIGRIAVKTKLEYPGLASDGCAIQDFNNDGYADLLLTNSQHAYIAWSNLGLTFENETTEVFSSKTAQSLPSVADADRDGNLDLLSAVDGKLQLASFRPFSNNRYTQIRVKGISDPSKSGRVNQYAIGSTIEVFAEGRYQSQIVQGDYSHFGLGSFPAPYNLRVIFTNGLTQNTLNPKINSTIEEKQILKGSCPFVYGWDGERWQLITDLLWNAPLGLQIRRGVALPDRRWEYLLLPGRMMQPIDLTLDDVPQPLISPVTNYELRVTEELWEAAYFDQIQLTAIDHPVGTQVFTNEKVGPASLAEPKVWLVDQSIAVDSIKDASGFDWKDALRERDGNYAIPFQKHYCQGSVELHYLDLDLSSITDPQMGQLYLTGWILPTDTSLNIAMDQEQAAHAPMPPRLLSVDDLGEFQVVQPMMGFPGGKPKTIVVPLKDAFLSKDQRLRIECSAEIYWDQIFFANGRTDDIRVSSKSLQLVDASLHYRGFSEIKPRYHFQPHEYDYQQKQTSAAWPPMEGPFTGYGDVRQLVDADDDAMVVMSSGDELQLVFQLNERELPDATTTVRDFVMHNVGWDKDADLNTIAGQSSLPLPFAAEQRYPAPAAQTNAQVGVDRINAPTLTRRQRFRDFWNAEFMSPKKQLGN